MGLFRYVVFIVGRDVSYFYLEIAWVYMLRWVGIDVTGITYRFFTMNVLLRL